MKLRIKPEFQIDKNYVKLVKPYGRIQFNPVSAQTKRYEFYYDNGFHEIFEWIPDNYPDQHCAYYTDIEYVDIQNVLQSKTPYHLENIEHHSTDLPPEEPTKEDLGHIDLFEENKEEEE